MKKVILVAVLLVMFILTACEGKPNTQPAKTSKQVAESTKATEPVTTEVRSKEYIHTWNKSAVISPVQSFIDKGTEGVRKWASKNPGKTISDDIFEYVKQYSAEDVSDMTIIKEYASTLAVTKNFNKKALTRGSREWNFVADFLNHNIRIVTSNLPEDYVFLEGEQDDVIVRTNNGDLHMIYDDGYWLIDSITSSIDDNGARIKLSRLTNADGSEAYYETPCQSSMIADYFNNTYPGEDWNVYAWRADRENLPLYAIGVFKRGNDFLYDYLSWDGEEYISSNGILEGINTEDMKDFSFDAGRPRNSQDFFELCVKIRYNKPYTPPVSNYVNLPPEWTPEDIEYTNYCFRINISGEGEILGDATEKWHTDFKGTNRKRFRLNMGLVYIECTERDAYVFESLNPELERGKGSDGLILFRSKGYLSDMLNSFERLYPRHDYTDDSDFK